MRSANFFFKMMQDVGGQLDGSTRVFKVAEPAGDQPRFLDLCMAPGGILSRIMKRNPGATATAYSLPVDVGGYEVLFKSPDVKTEMLDITMLAADLGVDSIPEGHLDANNFLPKQFHEGRLFDIVLCDGQVLRTQERPAYRKRHEARRLMVTQLVLGLEHLSPGGTMIILLHKPEKPASVELLRQFHRFSSVRLFKPPKAHAKRSSFYMIASNVQVEHPQAVAAVDEWKRTWKITTFGSEEEIEEHIQKDSSWAEEILEDFGPVLVDIGRSVWSIQAKALAEAPFIAGSSGRPQTSGQWGRKY
jgi:23S rRNA U2552 (ribose-2'-O)-methylase RlmE/FtsJ